MRKQVRKVGWYSWKGGAYDSEADLLTSSYSRSTVGGSAGLFGAGCHVGGEGLAVAEAGVVSC